MSRQLKFRVWDEILKTFFEWGFVRDKGGVCFSAPHTSLRIPMEELEARSEQFTELFDTKGKEIWEGDVCGFTDRSMLLLVKWIDAGLKLTVVGSEDGLWISFDEEVLSQITVIGNVHENPELMEGK